MYCICKQYVYNKFIDFLHNYDIIESGVLTTMPNGRGEIHAHDDDCCRVDGCDHGAHALHHPCRRGTARPVLLQVGAAKLHLRQVDYAYSQRKSRASRGFFIASYLI